MFGVAPGSGFRRTSRVRGWKNRPTRLRGNRSSPGNPAVKIDSLEIFHVEMPLIYPWRTAYGVDYEIHSVLVKAISGDRYSWAEATPLEKPSYSPEGAAGVFLNVSEYFAPRVVGLEHDTAESISEALAVFKGNPFAKAALEIA